MAAAKMFVKVVRVTFEIASHAWQLGFLHIPMDALDLAKLENCFDFEVVEAHSKENDPFDERRKCGGNEWPQNFKRRVSRHLISRNYDVTPPSLHEAKGS